MSWIQFLINLGIAAIVIACVIAVGKWILAQTGWVIPQIVWVILGGIIGIAVLIWLGKTLPALIGSI